MDTNTVLLLAVVGGGVYLVMQNQQTRQQLNDTQGLLGQYRSVAQRRSSEMRLDTPEERQEYTDQLEAAWRARYGDSTAGTGAS